ncbi:unnamed protein product [Owenia fusiformis]|uniref:Uncharacterized protein n=1 Tax=Owenia fusiformis TaxID=6347 RepID=A0A8J1XPF6_OWEFU|nr:unnamed protein product [Owenia fusiformis]
MAAVKTLIFGQSFIYWLRNFTEKSSPNFKLNASEFEIECQGIRGGVLLTSSSQNKKKHLLPHLYKQISTLAPELIYLQMGENDIDIPGSDPERIANAIISVGNYLLQHEFVKCVSIGLLFHRIHPSTSDYNKKVDKVNEYIWHLLGKPAKKCNFHLAREQIMIFPNKGLNLHGLKNQTIWDGIHLNDIGLQRFHDNLKRSLILTRDIHIGKSLSPPSFPAE